MKGNNAKILVIEDDPGILEVMLIVLSLEGYAVTGLDRGHDALEIIQRQHPDVILLDVMLGDANGLEICRDIKNTPDISDIPIMIISATHSTAGNGICEADDYLGKPFDIDDLLARVKALAA